MKRRNKLGRKSLRIVDLANDILAQYPNIRPTLRQVYYRLVASHEIESSKSSYNSISAKLTRAREEGLIPPDALEDHGRRIDGEVIYWDSPQEYGEALKDWTFKMGERYKVDLWASQDIYVEIWTEKDALAALLSQAASPYRVPVAVCHGYNSFTFLYGAVKRFCEKAEGRDAVILYFGDFDPSGEDMVRDLRDRLAYYFSLWGDSAPVPLIKKVALLREDIDAYSLPPDFTKKTDTRAKRFIENHGDISVELDALPPDVLMQRVRDSVISLISDSQAWDELRKREKKEKAKVLAKPEKNLGVMDSWQETYCIRFSEAKFKLSL